MTIINTTHRFIYVHIPKTAGTSMKRVLKQFTRYCDVEIGGSPDAESIVGFYWGRFKLRKHSFAREILQAVGEERYPGYYKFSFVRNPFARTLSTFKFLKHNFRAWRDSTIMDDFSTLEEFVSSDFFKEPGPDRILLPQMRWLTDVNHKKCVTYVGRVESLEEDFDAICKALFLPRAVEPFQKHNASKSGPNRSQEEALTGKAIDAIRARYVLDFEALGYSTDPEQSAVEPGRLLVP